MLRNIGRFRGGHFGAGGAGASGMLLGMNLGGLSPYDGSLAFANLMWQAPGWELESETSPNTTVWTQRHGVVSVSAVTGTATFRKILYTTDYIALADYMPAGTYTVKNPNGNANYSIGMGIYGGSAFLAFSTTAADRTFSYNSSLGMLALHMQVTATGSYGSGIKVLLPGHDGSDYFNAQFITFLQGLGASGGPLRLMDWLATNTTPDADWADRALTTDPALDAGAGVPWEVCIQLCNRLTRDPWINIPPRATSAYVTSLANLLQAQLSPGRVVYVERANEIWNSSGPFYGNTQWFTYLNHPRYTATVDPTAGVITRAAHGLANGESVLPFATRTTVSNGITKDATNANNNYYFAHLGVSCTVSDVTTNTFRIKDNAGNYITFPSVRGAIGYATNSVTDLIYVRVSDAGSTNLDTNYATQSVSDWAALDAVLGSSRVKAIMGSQAGSVDGNGNAPRSQARLAVTGASRFNYLSGAPYYKGDWFIGAVGIATGKLTPKFWTTDTGTATLHFGVYAQGSTPFNYEVENGTGTGFVAHTSYSLSYGARVSAPVTITNASPGVVTMDAPAPAAGNTVVFSTSGTLPAGLTAGTTYYVVNPSGFTFQVAATPGGAAINTTSAGSGTHTAKIVYGNNSYISGPAASSVDGTTYTTCMVLIDSKGYRWRLNKDVAASAVASTVDVTESSYAGQSLRHLLVMHDTNMGWIAAHQAAIAASGNPAGKYVCYEFAGGNQDEEQSAPSAALAWMRAEVEDAGNVALMKLNLTKMAAHNVFATCWFADVSAYSISWNTANSYYDTSDLRYVGLTQFAGAVPVYTQLTQSDIQAPAITSAPTLPYVMTALPADGTTYSVAKATPSADQYDVSGGNLRLLSNVGINYGVTTTQTIRLRKGDGKTDTFFNVTVSTGPAPWWEPTAIFALKMTTQSNPATLTVDVGSSLPVTAGTGGTFAGGYLNSGTTKYSSLTAMTSSIPGSTAFVIAFAGNIGTATVNGQQMWQFGTGAFISVTTWGANSVQWRWYGGSNGDVSTSNVTYDTTNAVHWVHHDGAGNCTFGHNQTTDGTFTVSGACAAAGLSRYVELNGENDVKGSCEIVPLAGMTVTDAKVIVQKIQNIHGI